MTQQALQTDEQLAAQMDAFMGVQAEPPDFESDDRAAGWMDAFMRQASGTWEKAQPEVNFGEGFGAGLIGTVGTAARAARLPEEILMNTLDAFGLEEDDQKAVRAALEYTPLVLGRKLDEMGQRAQGVAGELSAGRPTFWGDVGVAGGSAVAMAPAAIVGGPVASSALGAGIMAESSLETGEALGASSGEKLAGMAGGAALGALEGVFGAEKQLAALGRVLRGGSVEVRKRLALDVLGSMARSGAEEAGEEMVQGLGEEAIAEFIYEDPERNGRALWDWLNVSGELALRQGLPAGIVGSIMGGLARTGQLQRQAARESAEQKAGAKPEGPQYAEDAERQGSAEWTPLREAMEGQNQTGLRFVQPATEDQKRTATLAQRLGVEIGFVEPYTPVQEPRQSASAETASDVAPQEVTAGAQAGEQSEQILISRAENSSLTQPPPELTRQVSKSDSASKPASLELSSQPSSELSSQPESLQTDAMSGMGEQGITVAEMPTEETMFGPVERETKGAVRGGIVTPSVTQPNLLDIQKGDIKGQRSMLDDPAVTAKPRRDGFAERKGMASRGELGFRAWIRAMGGLNIKASGDLAGEVRDIKEIGDDSGFGLGPLVRGESSTIGVSVDAVLEAAMERGYLPHGSGVREVLALIESDYTPEKAERDAQREIKKRMADDEAGFRAALEDAGLPLTTTVDEFMALRGEEPQAVSAATEDVPFAASPTGPLRYPAAYLGGRVAIDARSATPKRLLFHEGLHHLAANNAPGFARLLAAMTDLKPKKIAAARRAYAQAFGEGAPTGAALDEEAAAVFSEDLAGVLEKAFDDPAKLTRVLSDRNVFEVVRDWIARIAKTFGGSMQTTLEKRLAAVSAADDAEVKLALLWKDTIDAIQSEMRASEVEAAVRDDAKFAAAAHGTPHDLPPEALVEYADGRREYVLATKIPDDARVIKTYALGRFRLDKIGTGEGAQAYGWGLYFAGNREIAEFYRKKLSQPSYVSGIAVQHGTRAYEQALNEGLDGRQAFERAVAILHSQMLAEPRPGPRSHYQDAANNLDSILNSKGRLYEVDLAPAEDEYLLWDKPLSEQSEKVKAALGIVGVQETPLAPLPRDREIARIVQRAVRELDAVEAAAGPNSVAMVVDNDSALYEAAVAHAKRNGQDRQDSAGEYVAEQARDYLRSLSARRSNTGEVVYRSMAHDLQGATMQGNQRHMPIAEAYKAASLALRSAGIRGIKYLDGSSRAQGEGNYNYVIFDEADVTVKAKFAVSASDLAAELERQHGVTLEIAEGHPSYGRRVWKLDSIVVPESRRGSGVGSRVMQSIVDAADSAGAVVALTPSTDFGASSVARLRDFYARFGFRRNAGSRADLSVSGSMIREPVAPKFAVDRERIEAATAQARAEGEDTEIGSQPTRIADTSADPEMRASRRGVREERAPGEVVVTLEEQRRRAESVTNEEALEKARSGQALQAHEQIALDRARVEHATGALKSGAEADILRAIDTEWTYQDVRRDTARALGGIRDALRAQTPAETIAEFAFELSPDLRIRIERATKRLKTAQEKGRAKRVEIEQATIKRLKGIEAQRVQKAIAALKAQGFDMALLTADYLNDPTVAARIARTIYTSKSPKFDWYKESVLSSMLSALGTQVVNPTGSFMNTSVEQVATRLGAAMANTVVRDPNSPSWGETAAFFKAFNAASMKAGRVFLQSMRTDMPVFEIELRRQGVVVPEDQGAKLDVGRAAIPGAVGRAIRFPSLTMMRATDEAARAFSYITEGTALAFRAAKNEGVTGDALAARTLEILNGPYRADVHGSALEMADRMTFRDKDDPVTKRILEVRKMADTLIGAEKHGFFPAGTMFMPFVSFGAKSLRTAVGLPMHPAVTFGRLLARTINQGPYVGDTPRAVQDVGRSMVSLLLLYGLLGLVRDEDERGVPRITGTSRPYERDNTVAPPMSVRIGDRWYSYERLDPASTSIATIVDALQEEDVGAGFARALHSLGNTVADKSYLATLGAIVDALSEPDAETWQERAAKFGVRSMVLPMIPNLVRSTATATDEFQRTTAARKESEDDGIWDVMGRELDYRILPTGARAPAIKYDTWGRPMARPGRTFFERLLSPAKTTGSVDDATDVDVLIWRYNQRFERGEIVEADARRYVPRPPDFSYTNRDGSKGYWTDEEYDRLQREAGQEALERLQGRRLNIEAPEWDDIERIRKAISDARSRVKREILRDSRSVDVTQN